MTSVHERNREKSPELLRFQTLAQSLDDNATRIAAKVIPKNYRFIIGVQMANAANELAELVDESLEHYPSNSVEAQERRRCYAQAIAKASEFDELVSDASEFVKCVHGLKKNIKVKGVESLEDAREWLLAQLEAVELHLKKDEDDETDDDVQS